MWPEREPSDSLRGYIPASCAQTIPSYPSDQVWMPNLRYPSRRPSTARRPEVLLFVNSPGWALDTKSDNIRRQLGAKYSITKRYHSELTEDDFERADLIAIYYWQQIIQLPHLESAFGKHWPAYSASGL